MAAEGSAGLVSLTYNHSRCSSRACLHRYINKITECTSVAKSQVYENGTFIYMGNESWLLSIPCTSV